MSFIKVGVICGGSSSESQPRNVGDDCIELVGGCGVGADLGNLSASTLPDPGRGEAGKAHEERVGAHTADLKTRYVAPPTLISTARMAFQPPNEMPAWPAETPFGVLAYALVDDNGLILDGADRNTSATP